MCDLKELNSILAETEKELTREDNNKDQTWVLTQEIKELKEEILSGNSRNPLHSRRNTLP